MSHTDTDPTNPGLVDDIILPFIDNDIDWDAFFNFDPETDDSFLIVRIPLSLAGSLLVRLLKTSLPR